MRCAPSSTHRYHGLGQGVVGLVRHGADQGHAPDRGADGRLGDLEHGLERGGEVYGDKPDHEWGEGGVGRGGGQEVWLNPKKCISSLMASPRH